MTPHDEAQADDFYDAAQSEPESFEQILPSLVPQDRLQKAEQLLQFLKSNEDFKVSPRYDLHYKGMPVPNGNLITVFHSLYQTRGLSDDEVASFNALRNVFKLAGVPHDIVTKRSFSQELRPKIQVKRFAPSAPGVPSSFSFSSAQDIKQGKGRKRIRCLRVY